MAKQLSTLQPLGVGLNNVGSYQVSGRPFASGNISVNHAMKVDFPMVTQYVEIINRGNVPVRVGFSEVGVSGSNYFVVSGSNTTAPSYGTSGQQRLKVSQIWLYSVSPGVSATVDVVAGLTNINRGSTAGRLGPSWSGSAGVG